MDAETILDRLNEADRADAARTDAIAAAVQQRDAELLGRLLGVSTAEATKLLGEVVALVPPSRPAWRSAAVHALKRWAPSLSLAAGLLLTTGNIGYRLAGGGAPAVEIGTAGPLGGAAGRSAVRRTRTATSSDVASPFELIEASGTVCTEELVLRAGGQECILTGETARVVASQDSQLIANDAFQWVEDESGRWRLTLLLGAWDSKRPLDVAVYTQCQPTKAHALDLAQGEEVAPQRWRLRFRYENCRIRESKSDQLP